ncbi:MAG: type III secretion system cytoplasmic ring protein SctQ [Bryobacteraceae bacterium]
MTAPVAFAWETAPRFSSAQAGLLNWFQRALPGAPTWRRWVRDVLSETLEYPAPAEVWLEETHCLGQREPERHAVKGERITIGRGEDADIVASAPAIAREHARLHRSGHEFRLEDLDSKAGTFVGAKKLTPGKAEQLKHGDRFTIFPYSFQLLVEQRWVREEGADLMAGPAMAATFAEFRRGAATGRVLRGIALEPSGAGLAIEASAGFALELARRMLRPVGSNEAVGALEQAAAEFLLLSVVERAGREMPFPLQPRVLGPGELPPIGDGEEGVMASCTVGIAEYTGLVRIFVPRRALDAVGQWTRTPEGPPPVMWRCPVEMGGLELTPEELRSLEPGDVVLYSPVVRLALPGGRTVRRGEMAGGNNFRVTLTDDWEEQPIMSAPMQETLDDARLDALPVRVSIIAGECEFSYAELKTLGRGAVIELDRAPEDPVVIALNGRPAGKGELVRIDGKLGVRVLSWKEPA